MILKILGSNSKGNCYLLENQHECLILEAGMSFDLVKKNLNYNITKICGCICTHEHIDHFKYVSQYFLQGIEIYCSFGTSNKYNIIQDNEKFNVGTFKITPFKAYHDALEPLNFLIYHKDIGEILFITDTRQVLYKNNIKNIKNIIIECNFQDEYIDLTKKWHKRIFENHLSINKCIKFLKKLDIHTLDNIILCHISTERANETEIIETVSKKIGMMPYISKKGMSIQL